MMKQINLIVFLMSLLVLSACTKDTDNLPPFVELNNFSVAQTADEVCNQTVSNVLHLQSGELLEVDVRFTDDTALSECTVRVTQNFDCASGKTQTWDFLDIVPIAGTDITPTIPVSVPSDASAGDYVLTVQISDESGNESNVARRSIKISNTSDLVIPTLSVDNPAASFSAKKGDAINFGGNLTDNNILGDCGIGGFELRYINANGDLVIAQSYLISTTTPSQAISFDFDYTIPTDLATGTYTFQLIAFDEVHNASETSSFTANITD